MILGTAGHIDHGKTTLVKALTGVDTDRLPEEKKRGITIDLGFAPLVLDDAGTIGIVDVPGHEGFIRTMLAGASGIDIGLLVIAADEGVMPQTREHLDILSLLKIQQVIVALAKSDLADVEWLALVRDEVDSLLEPTAYSGSPVVPVSARTGEGLGELRSAISAAAAMISPRNVETDLFRMPVDRVFSVRGTGTVVTGTIWSGWVARESMVTLYPGSRQLRVRAVETHGLAVASARAGERTALALAACDVSEVSRGSVLVGDPAWVETSEIDAELEIHESAPRITSRTRLRFHLGTSDVGCRVAGRGASDPGDALGARSRILLEHPVIARGGDHFVLRYPSPPATIGGGTVLDPYPARRRRSSGGAARRQLPDGDAVVHSHLDRMLAASGLAGVRYSSLPIRLGLPVAETAARCAAAQCYIVNGRAYAGSVIDQTATAVVQNISAHAVNFRLEPGVSLQTLRAAFKAEPAVIDAVLNRLVGEGKIELVGGLARPAGWKPELNADEQMISDLIVRAIRDQPNEPPGVHELSEKFGPRTGTLLRKLDRDGVLKRVSDDRYYSSEAVTGIVGLVRAALVPGRLYSPAELRDVVGVSRKYLIPLLEFFDRTGVTERAMAGRRILPPRDR